MFERKIYGKLKEWKESSGGKTALLVEGARRVGKTTVIEEFAGREYRSHILIDFSRPDRGVTDAFVTCANRLDDFFLTLSTWSGVKLYPRESLIIFDEVQDFPMARQFVKTLVRDGRYDYVETGSLISIRDNVKDITLPSEERSIKMYPMDFEEFCLALGEENLFGYMKECFDSRTPLFEGMHHEAMLLFGQYIAVGGMPQAVSAYLDGGRDYAAADARKRDILSLYRNDIAKIGRLYRSRVEAVFDQIPSFLSKHEKRVRLSNIKEDTSFPEYEDTFFWLGDSMIVNECFSCDDPNIGLALSEDRTYVKCYMNDTGLLLSHTFEETETASGQLYRRIVMDHAPINEGMFYENAVAQCLAANGHRLFFYAHRNETSHRNDMEIDFVLSRGGKANPKIFPVEVKSTKRYKTTSLELFMEKFKSRIGEAYILHTKNLETRGKIVALPVYMACFL